MKQNSLDISDEYVKDFCKWMLEWASKENSLIIPDMQQERGIGNYYFNYLKKHFPEVKQTYEFVKAKLTSRWLKKGMNDAEMPVHQAKLMMRYINYYDSHVREMLKEERQEEREAAQIPQQIIHHFEGENYQKAALEGLYKEQYDRNANKRRSEEKA